MKEEQQKAAFEALLVFLREHRGFDFTGYKRNSLRRRIDRRMQSLGMARYQEYQDYLEVEQDEFVFLFNTILINVTQFFRDKPAWDYLNRQVILPLSTTGNERGPIRVWSAGCASGQEAYTLAMLFAEAMGVERARRDVKIYAGDVDDEALEQARHAIYSKRALESVPEPLREKYFRPISGDRYQFHSDLRRTVIFGRHDLVQDAPISRLDLLVCRNTLMYFNSDVQSQVLSRFHFALKPTGHLFVGRAEMLLSHHKLFVPENLKHRLFAPVTLPGVDHRYNLAAGQPPRGSEAGTLEALEEAALAVAPYAQLVVDMAGRLAVANRQAHALFDLATHDIGRLFQDLTVSYRPVELRGPIEKALALGAPVDVGRVEHPRPDADSKRLDVLVVPLTDAAGEVMGAGIFFRDITTQVELEGEIRQVRQELETAYQEVQSANEELETTNEELQSANEELETTNEELQSANEELETMNEELQSSNEELQESNRQLRDGGQALHRSNAYMDAIVRSLGCAVVSVDRDMNIRLWNERAEDLWGRRQEQVVGQSILGLDIGLPVEQLKSHLLRSLGGESEKEEVRLGGRDRRGKDMQFLITILPIHDAESLVEGAVILMGTVDEDAGAGLLPGA